MKILLTLLGSFFSCLPLKGLAQVNLDYYLPPATSYKADIPTPASILGHEVGEWHVSHDKLVQYMYALAEASDRIEIEEYGRTHENRPLLLLKISAPDHIQKLESLRTEHIKISDFNYTSSMNFKDMPLVAYLGYSIHGNEASGSNAALLVAYHLAAAESEEVDRWLSQTIILLDPCFNPDGLNRFASWVNTHKSEHIVSDPNNIEQHETWPGGRTNHYWFDLNRDWLPAQHPESKSRLKQFYRWKPNVLTDHHEMGPNSTFFFQPGIPSRNNPLTPKNVHAFTENIAAYHAQALDDIGSLYFTKESYDDFYAGKGSSFADINGGIGILFEQAQARSHAQDTENGLLTFPFAIRNHVVASLSTLRAANQMKIELLEHQNTVYKSIPEEATQNTTKAYVFKCANDRSKLQSFLSLLETHQIETYKLAQKWNSFDVQNSYVIPLMQNQYRMIMACFETRKQFEDSLFYDVSAWTLPLAFDLTYSKITGKQWSMGMLGQRMTSSDLASVDLSVTKNDYGYAFHWQDSQAPALLYGLHQLQLNMKVAQAPWVAPDGESFERGSIFIPVQNQSLDANQLYAELQTLSKAHEIKISAVSSGYTLGLQPGSNQFKTLTCPKPLLLVGDHVNAYEAGEVWHLLDQRLGMSLPMVTEDQFNRLKLSKYNTLILVSGQYGGLAQTKLKAWLQEGGQIIGIKTAAKWLNEVGLSKMNFKKAARDSSATYLAYNTYKKRQDAQKISGAIFESIIDLSHPLGYGFEDQVLPSFRNSTLVMEISKNPYTQPMHYTHAPLLAGYASEENLKALANSPVVGLTSFGQGNVICFVDNPNFRGYWYGTNRLFVNALFFGKIIDAESAR